MNGDERKTGLFNALIIVLIFLFLFASNLYILGGTKNYQIYDAIGYFDISVGISTHWQWLFIPESRPPLPMFIGALFLTIFGLSQQVMILGMNGFFLLLTMFCLYDIAFRVSGDRLSALLTVVNFVFFPLVFAHSRVIMADLPLTAMVVVSYWSVMYSDFFRKRGPSLLSGLIMGLGLLTKPVYPVFLGPVILYSLMSTR